LKGGRVGGDGGADGGSGGSKPMAAPMVAESRVTAVWAKMRPLREEPVLKTTWVFTRKTPSRWDVVPASTYPATCQKTLEAKAPPVRRTCAPLPTMTLPVVLKMKMSEADPLMVMPLPAPEKETSLVHSYTPASKVWSVMRPAIRLRF